MGYTSTMKENRIAIGIVIGLFVIVGIAFGLYRHALQNEAALLTFTIDKENKQFVVTGTNLVGVDVLIMPTGTNVAASAESKLTTMNLEGKTKGTQKWVAHVPTQQFLATSIFVRAYDDHENTVGTKSLPYTGATEIYNALKEFWPAPVATSTTKKR